MSGAVLEPKDVIEEGECVEEIDDFVEDRFNPANKFYKLVTAILKRAFDRQSIDYQTICSIGIGANEMIWLILWTLALTYAVFTLLNELQRPRDATASIFYDRDRRRKERWDFWGKLPWRWVWPFRNRILDPPIVELQVPAVPTPDWVRLLDLIRHGGQGQQYTFLSGWVLLKMFVRLVVESSWQDFVDNRDDFVLYWRRVFQLVLEFAYKKIQQKQSTKAQKDKQLAVLKDKGQEQGQSEVKSKDCLKGLVQEDPIIPTFGNPPTVTAKKDEDKDEEEMVSEESEPSESEDEDVDDPKPPVKSNHIIEKYLFLPPDDNEPVDNFPTSSSDSLDEDDSYSGTDDDAEILANLEPVEDKKRKREDDGESTSASASVHEDLELQDEYEWDE